MSTNLHSLGRFFPSTGVKVAAALLLIQVAIFYTMSRNETSIGPATLAQVPEEFTSWRQVGSEAVIEQEVLDLLKADQILSRTYMRKAGDSAATLFVAFFQSQRAGVTPHSPKVCLPGSGWTPGDSATLNLDVPGAPYPIPVNRYIVTKGDYKSVVLYWYQSANRAVASEYAAKLYLMYDALRFRRSDTSLVRVVVPVGSGQSEEAAQEIGEQFIREFFKPLRSHLPA